MNASFKAECPHCFTTFNLKSRASVGKKVKCKSCGDPFKVKLVGDTSAAEEFDDGIEDYGDVEDYGNVPASALPPSRSSKPKPSQKKKKRKSGSSFPVKPVVIGLVVIAVGAGIWFGIQAIPGGNLFTMFDSPESLLDQYVATQYDLVNTLESIDSTDDMEWLKGKVDGYGDRIKDLNRRMILLAPVSEERAKEFRKYSEELKEQHRDQLAERGKKAMERLRNENLINEEFRDAMWGLVGTGFTTQYITPTPEPRDKFPIETYLAEQDRLSRDTAKVLVQVDDVSSARSHADSVKKLTERYVALKQHEHLSSAPPGSPFFSRRISWSGLITSLQFDVGEMVLNENEVKTVYDELSTAMHELTMAEHNQHFHNRPGGPAGGQPGFDPSRPGRPGPGRFDPSRGPNTSSTNIGRNPGNDKLKQQGLAMHNYHEVHKSFPGIDRDAQGHKGLSWRVHLLPFLEQAPLYSQFDLSSDWTSAKNMALQNQRPDVLKSRYDGSPIVSSFHVFEGKETPFGSLELPRLRDIRDGSSNTIMIIEGGVGTSKTWTMPGGLPFDPDNPRAGLGQAAGGAHFVLMFDGSVRQIAPNMDDQTLSRMIQHDDGKPLR